MQCLLLNFPTSHIVVAGGSGGGGNATVGVVEVLDLATKMWDSRDELTTPRSAVAMAAVRLYPHACACTFLVDFLDGHMSQQGAIFEHVYTSVCAVFVIVL